MTVSILSTVQTSLSSVWGTIATLFGTEYEWYVPNGANNPVSSATDTGQQFVAYFDREPTFPAEKARDYGKPEFFVAYDRGGPNIGDYLVGADTYFITDQRPMTPSKVVICNNQVSFYRPGAVAPGDPTDYSNYVEASPAGDGLPLAAGWWVSLLSGSRGEKSIIELPDSVRQPWNTMLCPAIPGVMLQNGDKCVDQHGFRYQISTVELTSLGYRIVLELAVG